MSLQSTKQHTTAKIRASEGDERIHEFLVRELPPGQTKQALYLTNALLKAGARYDRYTARKNEWFDYSERRNRLQNITRLVKELALSLVELDILSREDLASRVDPKEIETLIGSLIRLSEETTDLKDEIQKIGKRRDLAEERWILELADIYENAFGQPAGANRAKFCRLLELSRPHIVPPPRKIKP